MEQYRPRSLDELVRVLVRRRAKLGIGRERIAKHTCVSPITLWAIETGRSDPQVRTIDRYANGLGLHVYFLVPHRYRTLEYYRGYASIGTSSLHHRTAQGLSESKLSDALGFSVSHIEHASWYPRYSSLERLARAYTVNPIVLVQRQQ